MTTEEGVARRLERSRAHFHFLNDTAKRFWRFKHVKKYGVKLSDKFGSLARIDANAVDLRLKLGGARGKR